MSQTLIDQFRHFLAQRGLRMTGQRELIARIFFEHSGHISTEDLHHRVQKKSRAVGFATVYRTMKLLSEAGLAASHSFGRGFARYESIAGSAHHDHLVCTQCGSIIEFENDRIESLQGTVARKLGFRVTDHTLELYGICRSCQNPG